MNLIDGLNIEYIDVRGQECEARMKLTPFHSQIQGYLHGGATIAFAETLAGYYSNYILEDCYFAVGQSITANHLKSQKCEGYILAKGKLIHEGKSTHVWRFDMVNNRGTLISHITVTNAIVKSDY